MPEEANLPEKDVSAPHKVETFKETVMPKLVELGATKVTIHYSGSGDEGFIDSIEFEPDGVVIPPELKEQISDLADEFLYAEHGSWGDNDGSTGTIVIDPAGNKVINEHGWYFTDVNYETKEF